MRPPDRHVPVMLREALEWLSLRPEGWWVDATAGGGGHTEALLRATAPSGRVLAVDRDDEALERIRTRLAETTGRLTLAQGNYRDLERIAGEQGIARAEGILMDLGVSSFQLGDPDRGFAFSQAGPLDMRMDRRQSLTAAELLNHAEESELADLFYRYGEERRARRLAHWTVRQRPFRDTQEFARLAARAVGPSGRIHPATRAFQALRIAVNDELGSLEAGLEAAARLLAPGGRLVVISFHSLEDRIVKERLRGPEWERLTKHVVRPSAEETAENPRARSAKLRAARRRDT